MKARENSEIRELRADELAEVTGAGLVQLVRPAIGPAVLPASPGGTGGGGTGGGGGLGDGTSGGGGGGGTVDYTGDPYAIHHLF